MNQFMDNIRQKSWPKIALIVINIIVYIVMVILNLLSSVPGISTSLFPVLVGSITDVYRNDITPIFWVFTIIWTVIFVWNFTWLIYAVVLIFRRTPDRDRFYLRLNLIQNRIFILFIFQNLAIIGWLFLWTNKILIGSLILILLTLIPLYVILFFLLKQIYNLKPDLLIMDLKKDLIVMRILAQNGLAFFATWLSLATNLNFSLFLTYTCGVDSYISGTIALFIILAIIITYSILENIVWPRYLLYTFTPWFVLHLALIGVIIKNWVKTDPSRNNIITLIILIIVFILTVVKIVMFILYKTKFRHRIERGVDNSDQYEKSDFEEAKAPAAFF